MNNLIQENELLKRKNIELQRAANVIHRYAVPNTADKMIEYCNQFSKIYIYGAGIKGKRAYDRLISHNVSGFVVSKKDKNEYLGLPVMSIDEAKEKLCKSGTVLVIALNPKNLLETLPLIGDIELNAIYVME